MLTYEDCLGLCDLTDEEIRAIAAHEHIPEVVALELGQYLIKTEDGTRVIKSMILDDIAAAEKSGHPDEALKLKAVMRHFIETHSDHSGDD